MTTCRALNWVVDLEMPDYPHRIQEMVILCGGSLPCPDHQPILWEMEHGGA